MTPAEWDRITKADNQLNAFYTYWTQKEAVIKAHGHGLTIPLKSFEVFDNCTKVQGQDFYLQEIIMHPDYICSLALADERIKGKTVITENVHFPVPS
jgi:4'-phosphopantetheinyl transferase